MNQLSPTVRRAGALGLAAASAALIVSGASALTASAAPSSASTSSVCGTIKHCKVVKHVDVDGDHRKDTVAIVPKKLHQGSPTEVTVRVKLASGKLVKTTVKNLSGPGGDYLFRGAARLDGHRGAELFISHLVGAHGVSYRVLTYRHGALQTLLPPKADAGITSRDWFTDSALNFETGVFRSRHPGQPAKIKIKNAAYSEKAKRMQGEVVSYRWQNGGWHHLSTVKRSWAQEHSDFGGWHLSGLHGV
ncbi:hypothetical protein FOE78_17090 [Microlunatus elymi]|uniref:Uncharacterized protein n=1 Tax=Microlunatus elymi TaxID=2596828 RepID=A0A516Q1Y1_9ACTN|nr:hypothetical protein [Microlunatus elymi]QDP97408.1 hypothetical protein FOE78_17090 [Microlunatus elymi]